MQGSEVSQSVRPDLGFFSLGPNTGWLLVSPHPRQLSGVPGAEK